MAEKSDEEIIKEVGLDNNPDENIENSNKETDLENISQDETAPNEEELVLEEVDGSENDKEEEVITKPENNDKKVQKKQPKIFRILMGVIGTLVTILIIGIALYLLGYFDPEQKAEEVKPAEQVQKMPEININIEELDNNKINKKLNTLTKHEIMNKHELEAEEQRIKEEEEKRLEAERKAEEEKKKKMEEEINAQYAKIEEEKKILEEQQKQMKEEQEKFLALQEELKKELEIKKSELLQELETKKAVANAQNETPPVIENSPTNEMIDEENEMEPSMDHQPIEISTNHFLSFINVATLKGELYKSFLDDLQGFDTNISLCRDQKNRIEVYFGPYNSNQERSKVYEDLIKNGYKEAYLSDLTKEEYEKRCNY